MKIIHLGHVPVPDDHPQRATMGKIYPGRWVLNHARAQKEAGMDVEIVSQAHKARSDFSCVIEGVKVHFLRTYHPYNHFTFHAINQFRMALHAKRLCPDIVHAHGTESAYALAAIRTGLPFCVTAQGLMFQIIPALGSKPDWGIRFIRMSEHYAWKRTKYAVAKSEYVKKALANEYPHLQLELIHNTYQPELDAPLRPKHGNRLAFVGTIDERKGVHMIADAMPDILKTVPDVELHIIGNTQEGNGGGGYEREQIGRLRQTLGDRLVLHGRMLSIDLFAVLESCKALLAPSLEEMFGNQLIEGLMRGCHGIVTEGTALAENVRRFGNGTVIPQMDAASLAQACISVLHNACHQDSAQATVQAIRDAMGPDIIAASHLQLYTRIFNEAKR